MFSDVAGMNTVTEQVTLLGRLNYYYVWHLQLFGERRPVVCKFACGFSLVSFWSSVRRLKTCSKICMHCWNINESNRGFTFTRSLCTCSNCSECKWRQFILHCRSHCIIIIVTKIIVLLCGVDDVCSETSLHADVMIETVWFYLITPAELFTCLSLSPSTTVCYWPNGNGSQMGKGNCMPGRNSGSLAVQSQICTIFYLMKLSFVFSLCRCQ